MVKGKNMGMTEITKEIFHTNKWSIASDAPMRYFVLLTFFMVFLPSLAVSQTPRFTLETDRSEVQEGETFGLHIVLENLDGKNLQLPDVAPFKIVQGPATSTSVTIINGKQSASQSYQYVLLATQKGKFTIGSATIKLGSRILKSNTVNVTVTGTKINSSSLSVNPNDETFVRLEVNNDQVYSGQQVVLNLVLYTRQNIESYQLINEPDFNGFFAQPQNDIKDQAQRKVIKGKEFLTQVIRRWALFPQKTGKYSLGPVNCAFDVVIDNGNSSFFFRDTKRESAVSNTIKLNVNNIPAPAPKSFSGAIGNLTMKATIQKSTVQTGEAITLRMEVEGDCDSRMVQAPDFALPEGLEKYNPSVIRDETFSRGDKIFMAKEFEYIIVPSKDTIYSILPEITYLDINSGKYEKITAGPFTVQVVKGSGSTVPPPGAESKEELSPKSDDLTLFNTDKEFFGTSLYYLLLGSVLPVCLLFYLYHKHQEKTKATSLQKEQELATVALKCLQQAKIFMQQNSKEQFYEEISKATSGYVQKKYAIPNISSNMDEIITLLKEKSLDDQLINSYSKIQQECQMARFAGVYGNMTSVYDMAQQWIEAMERV
jgi:hypothetical protein